MAKKPKWLEEGTTIDLLTELNALIGAKMDKSAVNKAKKIAKEIIERQPVEEDAPNVASILEGIIASAEEAKELYEEEVADLEEDESEDEDVEEEEDDDIEDEDDEDDDEDDDEEDDDDFDDEEEDEEDDEEELDLDSLTLNELKKLAKTEYGIKGTKKWKKKSVAIKAIMDVVEEEEEDEDDENYASWTIQQLRREAKNRGIKAGGKTTKAQFAKILAKDDLNN